MRGRSVTGALLAIVLGLGSLAAVAGAQAPPPAPTPLPSPPPIVQPYESPLQPMVVPDAVADLTVAPLAESPRHPIRDVLHKPIDCIHRHIVNHPWYCWASHNSIGCGSLKAECNFIFGSCRTFYGEPCLKGPPPVPVPPGYGYGYVPAGCHCP